jgi:hypothetical protein
MELLPSPGEILARLPKAVAARTDVTALASVIERAGDVARCHTHGGGFSSDGRRADIELVALVRDGVVRALSNPELSLALAAPLFGAAPGTFGDWTLLELAAFARFRDQVGMVPSSD